MSKWYRLCLVVLIFCGCLGLSGCSYFTENTNTEFLDKIF